MHEADLSRIAELEYTLFASTGFTYSTLLQLYGSSGIAWLVAENPEGIWGYSLSVRATDDPQVGWILALGVHPDYRRRHVGWQLLDGSIVEMQSRGMSTIKLTVEPDNEAAYDMYRRAGFVDTGQWKEVGEKERRAIMTLLLPPG